MNISVFQRMTLCSLGKPAASVLCVSPTCIWREQAYSKRLHMPTKSCLYLRILYR